MSVDAIREYRSHSLSPARFVGDLHRDEPRLFGFSMLMLAAIPVTIFASLVDNRTFQGIDVVSFIIHTKNCSFVHEDMVGCEN